MHVRDKIETLVTVTMTSHNDFAKYDIRYDSVDAHIYRLSYVLGTLSY